MIRRLGRQRKARFGPLFSFRPDPQLAEPPHPRRLRSWRLPPNMTDQSQIESTNQRHAKLTAFHKQELPEQAQAFRQSCLLRGLGHWRR